MTTVAFDREWANPDTVVKVTVTDADENKPMLQAGETEGKPGTAAYTAPLFGVFMNVFPNKAPITDWVPLTLDDVDSIVASVAALTSRADFFDAAREAAATDTARLAEINQRENGALDRNDVIIVPSGLAVLQVSTYRVTGIANPGTVPVGAPFTLIYFGSVVNTVDVTLTSTADPLGLTVSLAETGPRTAVFEASFTLGDATTSTPAVAGTKAVLEAAASDVITAEYTDATEGGASVVATLNVQLSPPSVAYPPQTTVGPVKWNRAWTNLDQTLMVTVTDADLNAPVLQAGETGGMAFTPAYNAPATDSPLQVYPAVAHIVDWSPLTLADVDTIVAAVAALSSRAEFFDAAGTAAATDTARLAEVNQRDDGQLTTDDVIVVPAGLSVVESGINAVIIANPSGSGVAAGDPFTLIYFGAILDTTTVQVTSTSDPSGFTLTLGETGPDTGVFTRTIAMTDTDTVIIGNALTDTAAAASDVKIKAAAGDVITATYTDASEDNAQRTATVNVDLTPPALSILSPAHESLIEVRDVTLSAIVTDNQSAVKSTTIKFFLCVPTAVTDTTTCLDPGNFNEVPNSDDAADDDATTGFGFNTNPYIFGVNSITGDKLVNAIVQVELLAGDGEYKWYVSASDNAGNVGASKGDPGAPGEGAANPTTLILDTASKVTGTVHLQGAPQHDGVALQLGAQDAVTAEDGTFIFRKVPAGILTLTADAPGYLMARVAGIVVIEEAGTDTGLLVLLAGDVNDDGVVDDADFDAITAELGNSPSLDPVVDYTGDDQVDVRDLVLATRNRGKSELGAAVVDTASVGGVVVSQEDGAPLPDVGVTVQVDLNSDESFAPVGQGVFLAGFEQAFVETYLDVTDLQGAFSFDSVPFLKDGVALGAMLELQKDGFATFTQTFTFVGNTVLTIPIAASVQVADTDTSDGIQLVLSGSPAEVEVSVPPEAVPEGVTSVTGFITYDNPLDAPDLMPGNYLATYAELGEVQLESTVYVFVDLRDQDGNPILATNGSSSEPADIRMKVPENQYATLQDMTPDNPAEVTVPLYSFDYEQGIWLPSDSPGRLEAADGTPITQDQLPAIWSGQYVGLLYVAGKVSHFSRWNVDYPVRTHSSACGQIVDENGAPVKGAQIRSYGKTYTSNWTKPQYTDDGGTFCDDYKVSEEEEEHSPPAVKILEAKMISANEFRVRVNVQFKGKETGRTVKVKVELTNQGDSSPFHTLQDELVGTGFRDPSLISGFVMIDKGRVQVNPVDFTFKLADEGVPRFTEHVDVKVEATAIETWDEEPSLLTGTDDENERILLPAIIVHGILGDLSTTSLPGAGYKTLGPGMPAMVAAMTTDGYEPVGSAYPTAHMLVYPSLHVMGIQGLAASYLKPLVDQITDSEVGWTYANRVDLVAHSMGGLISRYYIESTPGLNQGDKVRKLVMVGTPNEGAADSHAGIEGFGVTTVESIKAPDVFNSLGVILLSGQTGATGETNIGPLTAQQLLPDYPYYREGPDPSILPYGYPPAGSGVLNLLGPNTFLAALNADGVDSRVEHYIIYRSQAFDKDGNPKGTINTIDVDTTGIDTTNAVVGPGDATVPVRSAIMFDYPVASDQLKKCVMDGTKHSEEMLDSLVRLQVRAILIADVGEAVPFCSIATPTATPRASMRGPLFTFMEDHRANSHPPIEVGTIAISGLAGELRRLEDQAPSVLSNMGTALQDYIQGLSDPDVTALTDALRRWGLETQTLWRHSPSFGIAVQTAASSTDVALQRSTLQQGVVDSFLHNVAQGLIQMMFNATAAAHSSEEAGQFSSHIADLDALRNLLDVLVTTQRAPQTWARVAPALTELGALSPGVAADAKVVEVEGLLQALSGEEHYSSWVLRDGDGSMVNVPLPEQVMGGSERASILVLWNGKVYQPQVSDIGVDWQDIGVPRIRTNSTGWVGSPSLSTESPARWIGAVTLVLAEQREITGRVVTAASYTLSGVTVRGSAAVTSSYRETVEQEVTTTGADGRFTLMVTQGPEVRLSLAHPSAKPTGPQPSVPAGTRMWTWATYWYQPSPPSQASAPRRSAPSGVVPLQLTW